MRTGEFFEAGSGSVLKSATHCIQTNNMTVLKINKSEPCTLTKSNQIHAQRAQNDKISHYFQIFK